MRHHSHAGHVCFAGHACEQHASHKPLRMLLTQFNANAGGATGAELPNGAVLQVQVQDPRLAKPIKPLAGVTAEPTLALAGISQLSDYRKPLPLHLA